MTQDWQELRWSRATDPGRPGFAIAFSESADGFMYVPGEIIMSQAARDSLPEITGSGLYEEGTPAAIAALGLCLVRYFGDESLPTLVDDLQARARAAATALELITHDPAIVPTACKVDLHYVFTGEGYLYHGGPATAPVPAIQGWHHMPGWGGPGDPQLVVLDTGVAIETPEPVRSEVEADPDDDVDMKFMPGQQGTHLGAEAGHGTFIAALAARAAEGLARIAVRKVLDADGFGKEIDIVLALAALRQAHPVTSSFLACGVLNMSFGTYTQHDGAPLALAEELGHWSRRGAVVVAAAGNNKGSVRRYWPAAFPRVVAVASVQMAGGQVSPSPFSNKGDWVDMCTVGEEINSIYVFGDFVVQQGQPPRQFNGWATWSGTSFAAPIIAGEVARRALQDGVTPVTALGLLLTEAKARGMQHGVSAPPLFGVLWDPAWVGMHPTLPIP